MTSSTEQFERLELLHRCKEDEIFKTRLLATKVSFLLVEDVRQVLEGFSAFVAFLGLLEFLLDLTSVT